MHLTLPTLLFLCFGFANAGVVFSRSSGAFDSYSGSGDFGGEISDLASLTGQEDYLNDHSDILASSNNEGQFSFFLDSKVIRIWMFSIPATTQIASSCC